MIEISSLFGTDIHKTNNLLYMIFNMNHLHHKFSHNLCTPLFLKILSINALTVFSLTYEYLKLVL